MMVGEMSGRLILSDHHSDLQVIAFRHSVLERTLATFHIGDIVRSQLLFPLLLPTRVFRAVILWVDGQSGLIILEGCDDFTPTLVVVDAVRI